jgi:hypothetical protein
MFAGGHASPPDNFDAFAAFSPVFADAAAAFLGVMLRPGSVRSGLIPLQHNEISRRGPCSGAAVALRRCCRDFSSKSGSTCGRSSTVGTSSAHRPGVSITLATAAGAVVSCRPATAALFPARGVRRVLHRPAAGAGPSGSPSSASKCTGRAARAHPPRADLAWTTSPPASAAPSSATPPASRLAGYLCPPSRGREIPFPPQARPTGQGPHRELEKVVAEEKIDEVIPRT